MKIIYDLGYKTINIFWRILFALTLYFAWTSPNIILGDNSTFGTSTTWLTTYAIIAAIILVTSLVLFQKVKNFFYFIFIKNQYITAPLLFIIIIILQILFVYYVHPVSGFDAGMLHYAAVNHKHVLEPNVAAYYSLNQNNLPITLLMRWIIVQTGHSSWMFFDYTTLVLVDISAILNILSIAIVKRKSLGIAIYVHCAWLLFFLSIIMPYTDAWVLPSVSLYILCYCIMAKKSIHFTFKVIAAVLFGLAIILAYFIKPSAIIPVIAIVIIEILSLMIRKINFFNIHLIQIILLLTVIGGVSLTTYKITSDAIKEQKYIKIQSWRSIPAIHFMSMGVYGTGGYNAKQALEMAVLQTKKQKTEYSKKMLFKRLKQLGAFGYLKFIIKKQGNNTADGTFGWLQEGHFFRENQKPTTKTISGKLKNFIFLYGRNIADFRFMAQTWWIFTLSIIALGYEKWKFRDFLKLSLVGGFLFLLLFEGGRSRYIIQYLPIILLLATISFTPAIARTKKIIAWARKD
ncbi:TIGR03766 family XrtG-associated glycosyltransferase [Liquorilactobacillus mali]|uniref:TIGR03766 family XrtG-associated glycosyltransferase n=1 Tax=Liquorilactobacillus mali TaxID=1618 RepID=UPI000249169E|nr:TIGR03766 family XrtG-associated glycosyltransferase [Liquorilactobacillus mali]QFQ74456.1 hypothetical protein LM596_04705 [Liquorilactobacillus mali]